MRGDEAVVLLSGGIDSATAAAVARDRGFRLAALSFDYGQRHAVELGAARRVAAHLGAGRHAVVAIDLRTVGASALTADIDVPKDRPPEDIGTGIPVTYVPARNTIFLAIALGWAEALGSRDIFIGVNQLDYSGYPDCRPEFIAAFERLARYATRAGVEGERIAVHAPLVECTKAEIIRKGVALGVDYALTHSCYDPTPAGLACGRCDACIIRRKGFDEARVKDPTLYATR
ncbi:MAG: 7-cyano-7-deazaguanine synthase QueC [Planctomycetes bacterium]|nr:7-cyano-7-deazaguanine synthase QueC [Planctomycetota bacterium]